MLERGEKLGERIKSLRKALGLSQTEFGERIGIKQTSVAGYENGTRTPLETVIFSICREFHVNETWLRTGKGDMFIQMTRDEEIATFLGETLSEEDDTFKKRFISMLATLDEKEWEILEEMAKKMLDK